MSFIDESSDSDPQIVNILDFYRAHGLAEAVALQVVLHVLLTRSYVLESEAREAALELGHPLPFVFPDNGVMH